MSKAVGASWERDLTNLLDAMGFAVIRVPTSGSATERELPDLLAGRDGHAYAVEAKYSSAEVIYLTEAEVDALESYAATFGAEPYVAVRFAVKHGDPAYGDDDMSGWYLFAPSTLYQTAGGNYRVKKEIAIELGRPLEDL